METVSGLQLTMMVSNPSLRRAMAAVHAAVVELDALADPVGAAAQNHDLAAVADGAGCGILAHCRWSSSRRRFPCRKHARLPSLPQRPKRRAGRGSPLRFSRVIWAMYRSENPSCLAWVKQSADGISPPLQRNEGFFLLHQLLHLLDKVLLDRGELEQLDPPWRPCAGPRT